MPTPLNPVRPGTEAELVTHLASTIGQDVFNAMENVGFEHTMLPPVAPTPEATTTTTPPEGDPTTGDPKPGDVTNASTSPAASTAAIDWEQYRDPETGLIMRKWKTGDEAVKGTHSLLHMAKEALAQRDALKGEIEQLRQRPTDQSKTGTDPGTLNQLSPKLEAVLKKAKDEQGLGAEELPLLIEALGENQELVAQRVIEKRDKEQTVAQDRWRQVDAYVLKNHPQALKHAEEMKVFLDLHPEYGRTYNRLLKDIDSTLPELDATLFAWNMYSQKNPHVLSAPIDPVTAAKEAELQAAAVVRREEVEKARIDAGLTGKGSMGVHETTTTTGASTVEDIDRAGRIMRQTGDGRVWRELTIGRGLTHPLFDNQ